MATGKGSFEEQEAAERDTIRRLTEQAAAAQKVAEAAEKIAKEAAEGKK